MATRKTSRATSLPEQRPDAAALWRRLRAWLATQGDAAYRTQIERLVPGIRSHGVRVPALRAAAKELKSETDAPTAASRWSKKRSRGRAVKRDRMSKL